MNQNERYQWVFRQYEQVNDHIPSSGREVVEWAVASGLLEPPCIDPMDVLNGHFTRALRAEYETAPDGRRFRVNHAVRLSKNGAQTVLWGDMKFAPRAHMEMAFTQRREQIVGDAFQLKTDVDVYNSLHADQPIIQLILDFTDDVAEREVQQSLQSFESSVHDYDDEYDYDDD